MSESIGPALARIGLAGAVDDGLEFQPALAVGPGREVGGWFRKIAMALTGADHVEHDAQAIQVGLRRARTFGRDEALGANERACFSRRRHEADVRQLRHTVHKDDVEGLMSRCTRP